jgi:hypothetical protein
MRRGIVLPACVLLIPALAPAQTLSIGSQDPFGGAGVFTAKGCVTCEEMADLLAYLRSVRRLGS